MKALIFFVAIPVFAQNGPKAETWKDESTGLVWAATDNGAAVSWMQAGRHCSSMTLGGLHDWRLPTIDELQHLVGASANASGFRIAGPIKVTGWEWSSSLGKEAGEAWALDFGDGGRASVVMGDSGLNRALCLRTQAAASR